MRNYAQFFVACVFYDLIGQPPPANYAAGFIQPTQLQLDADVQEFLDYLPTIGYEPRDVQKDSKYLLMDKNNLVGAIYAGVVGSLNNTANEGLKWFETQTGLWYNGPNDNPRGGWTDEDGTKREPPPSEDTKGAGKGGKKPTSQHITVLQYLSQIYAIFVVKPNPTRQVKKVLADLLANIRRIAAGTETQAQLDAIFAELSILAR
jgi:hypothetical protein